MNDDATNQTFIWLFYLLAIAAGALIPLQAAANAELSRALGNTNFAALVLFVVGLLFAAIAAVAAVVNGSAAPTFSDFATAPWWSFAGGLVVGAYVLTVTFLAPRLGIGTTILLIVAGQIVSAVLIDSFGLLRSVAVPLSWQRLSGIALIIVGVYLARRV